MPTLHVATRRVGDCAECGAPIHDNDLNRRCPSCGLRHDPEDPFGALVSEDPDRAVMEGFDDYLEEAS